jgi:hypothetical protein
MWIDKQGRRGSAGRRGAERRGFALLASLFLVSATLACTEAGAPGTDKPAAATASSGAPAAAAAPAATTPELKTVAEVFPAGPQKEAVMNNCSSCHNVACSAIGQRSPERWKALEESHKDKVSGADVHAMFEYLAANFNASKPEPKIPPRFLEGGCTPF